MCPEKERYQRECEHQISIYEQGTKPGTVSRKILKRSSLK